MIEQHVATAPIASMPLQKVRASGLERLYSTVKLAPSSVTVLHAVIGRALKIAVRDKLLVANPASAVEDRPRPSRDTSLAARAHCWTVDEVRRVRAAAKEGGPQVSAFMALLLDAGCRKSEALGLIWSDVDLDAGTVTIAGQLEPRCSERLAWGPTKTASRRTSWRGVSDTRRSARRSKPTPTRRLTCRSTPPA
jgi:integrase